MSARRGRAGGLEEARELVALLGALEDEGNTVSVKSISKGLGCSSQHARHLLMLLLQLRSADGTPLPLLDQRGNLDSLTLFYGSGVRGRTVRLSNAETEAVLAALAHAGVSAQDPLARRLRTSLGSTALNEDEIRSILSFAHQKASSQLVLGCSAAIAAQKDLTFSYTGGSGTRERRRVSPRRLYHKGGLWYLEAFDRRRREGRTFRLDRMTDLKPEERDEAEANGAESPSPKETAREVRLTFLSGRWLELLEWPHLRVLFEEKGRTTATIPYYGGKWLVRHLAACGSDVLIEDAELREAVNRYARELLHNSR